MACVVPGCPHRQSVVCETNLNVSFHRFPPEFELREAWVKNINRSKDWKPTQYSKICSVHFEESCFCQGGNRRTLHLDAVPTIFVEHPISCLSKLIKKETHIAKYETASTSTATDYERQIQLDRESRSRICELETVNKCSIVELNKTSKLLRKYKILAARRLKKLRTVQRRCSRLEEKKADLEAIIQTLHDEWDSAHVSIPKNTLEVDNGIIKIFGGNRELEQVMGNTHQVFLIDPIRYGDK